MSDDAVEMAEEALGQLTAIEGVDLYWDMYRLESFSDDFRKVCIASLGSNRKTLGSLHALTNSLLISMAVKTADIVLSRIVTSYRDEAAFQHAFNASQIAV